MGSTVLVTGVSRFLGAMFARALASRDDVDRVVGVDAVEPRHVLGGAEFVRADLRNPMIGRILAQSGADTVVHLNVSAETARSGRARVSQKERNVIGTMHLLAACQGRSAVRRVVMKSTGAVYGAAAGDPAVFTEAMAVREYAGQSSVQDAIEAEGYARGVSRRRPDIDVCVLRMANVLGRGIRSPLADYLRAPVWPVPFGFDARLHLLHPHDAVAALTAATMGHATGTVNVASEGLIPLSSAARVLHRATVPVPTLQGRMLSSVARRGFFVDVTREQAELLMWGRALDITRMRVDLGVEPRWTSRAALEDFADAAGSADPTLEPSAAGRAGVWAR